MTILVLNAGSSSLKFALFAKEAAEPSVRGIIDWKGDQQTTLTVEPAGTSKQHKQVEAADYLAGVKLILATLEEGGYLKEPVTAVGHRVVHGGVEFRGSVRIDAKVKETIQRLSEQAPLHNPPALETIRAAEQALPDVPHVAVFDTAFHATLEPSAYLYAVPFAWYEQWGIRRFGFHGISHEYCSRRAAEMLERDAKDLRLVICHLGNGCSATAVKGGKSIATTMGFTPLEGLMMGTRSGSVDPGVLLSLLNQGKLTAEQLDQMLNHESGLLGISGVSSDFRSVQQAADQGHNRAQLALRMYANRVRTAVGALAVHMGGLDALVFTAGVGENSASLRAAVCPGLECLGLRLDSDKNNRCQPDKDIAQEGSEGRILVIRTREELLIAQEAAKVEKNQY